MSSPAPTPGRRTGLGRLTAAELHKAAAPQAGRWLLVASAALGLLAAAVIVRTVPLGARGFAALSYYVQSAISLPLPFVSIVLMTRDFGRRAAPRPGAGRLVAAKLLASAVIAVLAAGYGIVLGLLAVGIGGGADPARWVGAGLVVLGSFLVQLIAQLVGAGFGLLIGSTPLAIAADVLVPLGLWALTGTAALRPLQAWLTPFASVGHLLSGRMDTRSWAQVLVVAGIWAVGLNVAGVLRLRAVRR